jgi:hypothetical protein
VNIASEREEKIRLFCRTQFELSARNGSTLILDQKGDPEWRIKQEYSVESYATEHVESNIDEDSLAIYKLFGSYINSVAHNSNKKRPMILDVGCGMFPLLSPGIKRLDQQFGYIGLDPLSSNLKREYPFICGRIEDLASLSGFDLRFDIFVFGTSLDHLEDLKTAAAAVRQLASPDAILVCWNGLQDPKRSIARNGVAVFKKLLEYRWDFLAILAYFGYGLLRLPKLLAEMNERKNVIAKSGVMDHHLRWFTENNLNEYLSVFGNVTDVINLPNSVHSFATVKIK